MNTSKSFTKTLTRLTHKETAVRISPVQRFSCFTNFINIRSPNTPDIYA
nr:MAG TPA: hypothetical protein [Caudoviricetes sp.]